MHASGRIIPRMVMVDDDRHVPGLARLAKAIRRHGAVAIGQINHCGRQNKSKVTGQPLLAPSAIPCPVMKEMPRALEPDEIVLLQEAYADAAVRLQEAGFDGTEIHAAHGYLAASFLSSYSNRSEDEYGGNLPNRLRFLAGIVDRSARALAKTSCCSCERASRNSCRAGRYRADEAHRQALAARGVDVLSLSVGCTSRMRNSRWSPASRGSWLGRMAQCVRRCPFRSWRGRIRRLEVAEAAVGSGQVISWRLPGFDH